MAASLSIASNFNFLYTNFMRESVTEETVSAELEVFRDDLVETRARILSMDSVRRATERKTELDMEIRDLVEQGTDPLRPGCGERCREHMANIEAIIGRPLTDFAVPQIGASSEVMSEWLTRYSAAAEETFLTSLGNSSVPALTNLAERIEATLSEFPTADIVVEQRNGLEALKDMKSLSEDYEREANALLPETMQVDHEPIDPTLGRLGEIAYSLENGFVDWPNPAATVLSLFLASIVDILPLMLSFALFGPGRLERKGNAPSVRGNRGATVVSSSSIR